MFEALARWGEGATVEVLRLGGNDLMTATVGQGNRTRDASAIDALALLLAPALAKRRATPRAAPT